jgi:hypothetical protein
VVGGRGELLAEVDEHLLVRGEPAEQAVRQRRVAQDMERGEALAVRRHLVGAEQLGPQRLVFVGGLLRARPGSRFAATSCARFRSGSVESSLEEASGGEICGSRRRARRGKVTRPPKRRKSSAVDGLLESSAMESKSRSRANTASTAKRRSGC